MGFEEALSMLSVSKHLTKYVSFFRSKVLATHENSNIVITGVNLQCLRPSSWLNDEVRTDLQLVPHNLLHIS